MLLKWSNCTTGPKWIFTIRRDLYTGTGWGGVGGNNGCHGRQSWASARRRMWYHQLLLVFAALPSMVGCCIFARFVGLLPAFIISCRRASVNAFIAGQCFLSPPITGHSCLPLLLSHQWSVIASSALCHPPLTFVIVRSCSHQRSCRQHRKIKISKLRHSTIPSHYA